MLVKTNKKLLVVFLLSMLIVSIISYIAINMLNSSIQVNIEINPNEKIYSDIYSYIKSIDRNLINTALSFDESTSTLNSTQKLDIIINEILNNLEKYNSQIKNLEQQFVYKENETEYYSLGYVNKSLIRKLSNQYFNDCNIDIENYKYYDLDTDMVALVEKRAEYTDYSESKFLKLQKIDKNKYMAKFNYKRKMQDRINEFNIEYYINIRYDDNNDINIGMQGFNITDSIIY